MEMKSNNDNNSNGDMNNNGKAQGTPSATSETGLILPPLAHTESRGSIDSVIVGTTYLAALFLDDQRSCDELLECFESVPSQYFSDNFDCFEGDMNLSDNQRKLSNHKLRSQKTLNKYLEKVEFNLLRQICIQSNAFFNGLKNIQSLEIEVNRIVENICVIRNNLKHLQGNTMTQVKYQTTQKCDKSGLTLDIGTRVITYTIVYPTPYMQYKRYK